MKNVSLLFFLSIGVCATRAAFADNILDPVGFCAAPATVQTCTTGTGIAGETIGISSSTSFGMFKNGNGGTASSPWLLLVIVPEPMNGGISAPTITNVGNYFTQQGPTIDEGSFFQSSNGSIYDLVGQPGDNLTAANQSMNAPNLFSQNEVNARGSLPSYFEVFGYSLTPAIQDNTGYTFSASGLVAGTYLAAAGGSQPFSTPYTVTGLIEHTTSLPEPASMFLFGSGFAGFALFLRSFSGKVCQLKDSQDEN